MLMLLLKYYGVLLLFEKFHGPFLKEMQLILLFDNFLFGNIQDLIMQKQVQ